MCPSCVHRVAIGRLRVCVGSVFAFYQIREENRAKLKISYSCGHRVSKSARYDATLTEARDMSMTNTLDPTNVYLVIQTCINLSFAAGTMLAMLYNSHHSTQIIKLDKTC